MTITPEYIANWFRKKFVRNHPYCESGFEMSKDGKATVIISSHNGERISITIEDCKI